MMFTECLHDNRVHDVPKNIVSLHKRQEDRCDISRERGNVSGSGN